MLYASKWVSWGGGQVTHHPSGKSFRQPDFPLKYQYSLEVQQFAPDFFSGPKPNGKRLPFPSFFSSFLLLNFGCVLIHDLPPIPSWRKPHQPSERFLGPESWTQTATCMWLAGPVEKVTSFFVAIIYIHPWKLTNVPFWKELCSIRNTSSKHWFSGDMLVFGRVHQGKSRWHSPYILVYGLSVPNLTYFLKPSILTWR